MNTQLLPRQVDLDDRLAELLEADDSRKADAEYRRKSSGVDLVQDRIGPRDRVNWTAMIALDPTDEPSES